MSAPSLTASNMAARQAVLLVALAVLGGAGMDALVKAVGRETGLITLLTWRFIFGGALAALIITATGRRMPGWKALRFHVLRSMIQLSAAFTFFYAILQLGLAEATVFGFTATLMVAPLARLLLGERMDRFTIMATLVGFVGVLVALSASPASWNEDGNRVLGLISVFVSTVLYALTLNLMRLHTRREDPLTIAAITNIVPVFVLVPIYLGLEGPAVPAEWPWLALLGVLGLTIWTLMTLGYARAEAQHLAPLEYTALIWSAVFGALFFGEFPDWPVYVGAGIIIAACLAIAFRTGFRARREARAPSAGLDQI